MSPAEQAGERPPTSSSCLPGVHALEAGMQEAAQPEECLGDQDSPKSHPGTTAGDTSRATGMTELSPPEELAGPTASGMVRFPGGGGRGGAAGLSGGETPQ